MGELSNTTINGVSYDFKDAGAARQSHSHTKSQITDFPTSMPASDVSAWAKASKKPTYKASEVGAIATSAKGAANGVASLDSTGKVPSSQLPSYVDDVLEYSAKSSFPATGETGKIYVDASNNKTYRWSGSAYVEISESLALGDTSSTAYYGDKGKTAYDHSQTTSGNPHNVTKTDVGLSNVGNFKAVSTVASQGLSSTEQANARANIGAGTSSFSGSYNDLSNKPTIPTKVSQLTNDAGYTTNTGTYSKPSGGIPKSDLASAVRTSLGKADSALQSETDPTVPSWAKKSSKPSYTASEVGAVPTSRTINGYALDSNIDLLASDIGSTIPGRTVADLLLPYEVVVGYGDNGVVDGSRSYACSMCGIATFHICTTVYANIPVGKESEIAYVGAAPYGNNYNLYPLVVAFYNGTPIAGVQCYMKGDSPSVYVKPLQAAIPSGTVLYINGTYLSYVPTPT